MNIYITTGTYDYLKKIGDQYALDKMAIMENENGALLLHETNGPSVFKEPRKFEVIGSAGTIKNEGIVVMKHISVSEEGRPIFEHQLQGLPNELKKEIGFIAIRILRPQSSSTYLILTIWENEMFYQKSKNILDLPIFAKGADLQQNIFTSSSYLSKYTIIVNN